MIEYSYSNLNNAMKKMYNFHSLFPQLKKDSADDRNDNA